MEYISLKAAAAGKCLSERQMLKLCETGRVKGAVKADGSVWLIPKSYLTEDVEDAAVSPSR